MWIFDKLKNWLHLSDTEKVQMDRRAFLKGMTITAGGLLVPGAVAFDMGRLTPRHIVSPHRVVFPLFEIANTPEISLTQIKDRYDLIPVRTEMTVLSADDPNSRVLGFKIKERLGIAGYNSRGVAKLTGVV